MNGISSKVAAGGIVGAVVGIVVWVAGLLGLVIPPEIAVYLSTIIGGLVAFAVKETATKKDDEAVAVLGSVDEDVPAN